MNQSTDSIAEAIKSIETLLSTLKKSKTKQVRSKDEQALMKATASAWFKKFRGTICLQEGASLLSDIDVVYRKILEASDQASSRNNIQTSIKKLRKDMIRLRSENLCTISSTKTSTSDTPPDFSPLVSDPRMQTILKNRWKECTSCLEVGATLAATVMMGGLLETLLLGRVNRESDKTPIFTAKSSPKDKSGNTKKLNEWTLKDYISVVHDLGWISISVKQIAEVLRDFRNYIHPHKQLVNNVHLSPDDASLFWEISKNITRQLISSCAKIHKPNKEDIF